MQGPCYDPEGYPGIVKAVTDVLDGNAKILIESLQNDMDKASEDLNYERAAGIRDMIASVHSTLSQQIIHSRFYQDCDAIGISSLGDSAVVIILHAKDGVVQGKTEYPLIHRGDISESVSLVLVEHYPIGGPESLAPPSPIGDSMEKWLRFRRRGSLISEFLGGGFIQTGKMVDRTRDFSVTIGEE